MDKRYWYQNGSKLLSDISSFNPPKGSLAIWYIGQMGLVVKGAGKTIYIDPYFEDTDARKYPPPYSPEEITGVDLILGTHDHIDHIDRPTLAKAAIASPSCRFIVPAPHTRVLANLGIADDRIIGGKFGEVIDAGGVQITPIPAAHEELHQDNEGNYLELGYILEIDGIKLYHSGDTTEYEDLVKLLKEYSPHIICLPINGRDLKRNRSHLIGNMNAREAVDVGCQAGAKLLIPLHYDMFAFNSENPAYFADYLYRAYPAQPFKIMAPGERFVYFN